MKRLRVSEHAKERIRERVNVAEDSHFLPIALSALMSDHIDDSLMYEMGKYQNRDKFVTFYLDSYFVFGIHQTCLQLVTVYKKTNNKR